ncbi:MAG TPA: hypothetical protein VL128_10025 [Candidatus Eisenbacteria bacterium]|nr:hypothetical protein [Candidatus Eisenbacteria bacterium]
MEAYLHIRVLFSMILGLGVARLLGGAARIVQHPREYKIYWIHLLWALFLFLYLIHFWWWEFHLSYIKQWTFPLYFFIALYAVMLFFLCVLLFPEEMADYQGFKDYFYSRKHWIFGLLVVIFIFDLVDTFIKGKEYVHTLGVFYYARTALYLVLSGLAIKLKNEHFQAAFAILAVVCEVVLIFLSYLTVA